MVSKYSKLNNTAVVYVTTFDTDVEVREVLPTIRNEAIQSCTDTLTKQQRYCVWRLLDYALRDFYGKGVEDFRFYVDDNGKWSSNNGVEFSLSHCNNVVAVAICHHFVGVDVECVGNFVRHANSVDFAERVLTDNEQALLREVSEQHQTETLARMWTRKESIFKLNGGKAFLPKSVDTTVKVAHSQLLTLNGEDYVLSVATYIPAKIELAQVDWKHCQ